MLEQIYFQFEVVVVNDRSTDATSAVLYSLGQKYSNLRVVESEKSDYVGKKQALQLGIKNAQYDYFLLTDADCEPSSTHWLSKMASGFSRCDLVIGISPYYNESSFVGKLVQYETALTAQHYISFALAGIPYMGVGRNMAYSRKLYQESSGFQDHLHLPSGDDDLFVSQVANSKNTELQIHSDAFTFSNGPSSFSAWWKQKRRHYSTSVHYRLSTALLLGSFGLAQMIFYLLLIPLLLFVGNFSEDILMSLLIVAAAKFILQGIAYRNITRRMHQKNINLLFPLWEFLVVVFLAIIHVQNKWAPRPQKWN